MVEKVFKIICSSKEHLTADTVALALLKQVSIESKKEKIFFAVQEVKKNNSHSKDKRQVCFIEE